MTPPPIMSLGMAASLAGAPAALADAGWTRFRGPDGAGAVLGPKPEFKLTAPNTFSSDDSQFNATPALGGGQLILRSDKHLYCVEADLGQ